MAQKIILTWNIYKKVSTNTYSPYLRDVIVIVYVEINSNNNSSIISCLHVSPDESIHLRKIEKSPYCLLDIESNMLSTNQTIFTQQSDVTTQNPRLYVGEEN